VKPKNKQLLVAYIPVIHQGYQQFFQEFPQAKELWLIGQALAHELQALQKDIRALPAKKTKQLLEAWQRFESIEILTPDNIDQLQKSHAQLVFPNDQLSRHLTRKYFKDNELVFGSIFLRWDSKSSTKNNDLKDYSTISSKEFDQKMIDLAIDESTRSDDWWRQIGGIIFKDGKTLLTTHNQHVPTEYESYYEGDPRADFSKGEYLKVSTAIHAEAYLIAQAAQQGISLKGADLYITTFPCPVCAKQVAYSGIKRVFFQEGYSILDGEKVLKANDVELIQVK
jgi:dCMP deaminase